MSKLYRVLRVKMADLNEDYSINIKEEDLRKYQTLLRENEIIRIVKVLDPNGNSEVIDGYTYIKDIVTVNVTVSKYEVDYMYINDIKYKRLLASSGNIRNKKIVFIKEELFDRANEILLCGLPKNMEHNIFAKFNSYYALVGTDTEVVTTPNFIVVDDYKKNITEKFDLVIQDLQSKKLNKNDDDYIYKCIPNQIHSEEILPFDGGGLVDISLAEVWSKELNLDYVPASFQFRQIIGIKGNVYTFNIKEFARENNVSKIVDAFGVEYDLFKDNINAVLTVSQFKFFKKWQELYGKDGFKQWKKNFETDLYGYKRTFNISMYSDKPSQLKNEVVLSYQPLQSLDLSIDEVKELCTPTIQRIKKIATNVDSFLKFRGLESDNKDMIVPSYYKALKVNKELFYDSYIQKKVKADLKATKENTYKGGIFVKGNYQTLIPDILGLAEFIFGLEVKGCLNKNEIYSNYWCNNNVDKVDIIRFPHIAMEHAVVTVKDLRDKKWLKYCNEGIVTSMYDTIALKLNSADFDGDHILTTSDKTIIKAAQEQMSNTIAFKQYKADDVKKKKKKQKQQQEDNRITNIAKIIKTDKDGMKNNIGSVVNEITKLWSLPVSLERDNYIKIMSIIGSLTIDFVKTGEKAKIPTQIRRYLKEIKKPEFMRVRYKKQVKKEDNINKNNKILGLQEVKMFNNNDCTMNRIYNYCREELSNVKLKKEIGSFNVVELLNNKKLNVDNKTYPIVREKLIELQNEYYEINQNNSKENDVSFCDDKLQQQDISFRIFYSYCKTELRAICKDKNKLLDYLLYCYYLDKKFMLHNQDKSILWNCFGSELNVRAKGKDLRFKEVDNNKLVARADKLKKKVKEIKKSKKTVNIKLFNSSNKVKFSKEELEQFKKIKDSDEKKIAFTLFSLEKFCKANKVDKLRIYAAKKDNITRSQILKLSNVHSRKWDNILIHLKEEHIINLESARTGTDTTVLNCHCNLNFKNNGDIILEDINQINKLFKKLI